MTTGFIDVEAIEREIANGYINLQSHPKHDLRILNYSQKAQVDWRWNRQTMQCRGLIVDRDWNVVARPFEKFFSVEQLNGVIPSEPFEAFEKLDGSLGVLYFADGQPHIASRGSFTSEQSQEATRILRQKYSHVPFDQSITYLFEVIYPENRIVVDYGELRDLFLLAVIETSTARELTLPDIGLPIVKRYDGIFEFDELIANQDRDREGFVVRFQSGQRVKIKFDEYKRLHKLLTGVTPRAIWEVLRSGGDMNELLEQVPDEFFAWVRETQNRMLREFSAIESQARQELRFDGTRRELAEWFQQCRYPGVMFSMLDGKDYRGQIWRIIKPTSAAIRSDEALPS